MSRRRFDKKNAKTFAVVHRAHDDARYYDDDASQFVLAEQPSRKSKSTASGHSSSQKILLAKDIEQQLSLDELQNVRNNEGEAAQYGIFFDDTKYDYMKHLKPIGQGDGVFILAQEKKAKNLDNIETLFGDNAPSQTVRKVAQNPYQAIPDELAGFKPDMDPRLREVLEALEDEAYIDEKDEGLYGDLLQSGEVDDEEFYYGSDAEQYYNDDDYDDDYDEWDLDNYQDEYAKYDQDEKFVDPQDALYNDGEAPEGIEVASAAVNSAWRADFSKFKKQTSNKVNEWDSDDDFEDEEDEVPELPNFNNISGKKQSKTKMRKKKGAMTDTSSFSMSSSANFRTEGLTLLDDRFEQLSKKMEQDDDDEEREYKPFDLKDERPDLEDMLDDFLENYELQSGGRKLAKKDQERKQLQEAADSVSKGKAAARRKKEKKDPLGSLGSSFSNLKM